MRRYDEALIACRRSLEINPRYPMGLANYGMVLAASGDYAGAARAFEESVAADPEYVLSRWNLSVLQLGRGNYKEGLAGYDSRIDRNPKSYPKLAMPLWQGEDLKGKSIHIESEQGIGDTVLFSRFLPELAKRGARVYFCTTPGLTSLIWNMSHLPGFGFYPQKVPLPPADYYAYMGSVPRWLNLEDVDGIPADPGLILQRAKKAGKQIKLPPPASEPAFKIGICWTGNPEMERNEERSIPLKHFIGLAADPRVWLYSLQAGPSSQQIHAAGADGLICDLNSEMLGGGIAATATAILQLDLVITCCTSIAHLAGALGVPCWVLLCTDPYWPWLFSDRTDSPWYPSVRLFRQRVGGDWDSVMQRVGSELGKELSTAF